MAEVLVRAPAKVNLALVVGPLRDDGYHDLATVFHALGLLDEVELSRLTEPGRVEITVEGEGARAVPLDESNLAVRAARELARYAGVRAGVRMHVRKAIPVAGGMAGGSADAAAALVGCDAVWGTGLGREELLGLAARLGSDVPFSLIGGTAVGTGRGERLTPALARGSYHWVLALADGGLPTPAVYAELDRLRARQKVPAPRVPYQLMTALRAGDPAQLGARLTNDLQAAACSLRPDLRDVLDSGRQLGALGGIVSGSGPTCAFLARSAPHAIDLAVGLAATSACRDVRRASGPASGARVVTGC